MKRCQWGQRALTDSGVATVAGGEMMVAADSGERGGDGRMPMGADVSGKGRRGWQRSTWVVEVDIGSEGRQQGNGDRWQGDGRSRQRGGCRTESMGGEGRRERRGQRQGCRGRG